MPRKAPSKARLRRTFFAIWRDLGIEMDRHEWAKCNGFPASMRDWTVDDHQQAIAALRDVQQQRKAARRRQRPDLPPGTPAVLAGAATAPQLQLLDELIGEIQWRKPEGWRPYIRTRLRREFGEAAARAWSGELAALSRKHASAAIRVLVKAARAPRNKPKPAQPRAAVLHRKGKKAQSGAAVLHGGEEKA